MTNTPLPPVTPQDLQAYADGQLAPQRAAQVEDFLAAHPEAAAEIRDIRLINAALRDAFVQQPLAGSMSVPRPPRPWRLPMAAAIAGLVLGAAIGAASTATVLQSAQSPQVASHALAAYKVFALDAQRPVEIAGDQAGRLASWLSQRMGMAFAVPALDDAGFTLVGGRLMAGDGTPAGMLMYENQQGRRVVLYVKNHQPSQGRTTMRFRQTQDGGIVTWQNDSVAFGLAGGFSEQELRPVADRIRGQFPT